jgi:hypothetical protein
MIHRDMYLLESRDHGATFTGSDIAKWDVGYCVMSAESFVSGPSGMFAAWESEKQVHFGRVNPSADTVADAIAAGKATGQKYPSLAENKSGLLLVSWTEGMGWKRGGSLHWELFDRSGQPASETEAIAGVPAWSLVAAYPRSNGNFAILY